MRVVSLLAFVACASLVQASYLNVHGDPLQRCSQAGMALTGYTRSGECYAHDDDHGSHHVCVDVSSTTGGNFCSVTGQPNWCSSKMQCDASPKELCPVKQWCVCQWAFASYIDKAGGCDHIQNVVCEATNMQALLAYERQASQGSASAQRARACLIQKCKL